MDHLQDNRDLLNEFLEEKTDETVSEFQQKKRDYFDRQKLKTRESRSKKFSHNQLDLLEMDWQEYSRNSLPNSERIQWTPFQDLFLSSLTKFLQTNEAGLDIFQLEAIESAVDNFSVLCGDFLVGELAQVQSQLLKHAILGESFFLF